MLSLHACAHTAPDTVSNAIDDVGSLPHTIIVHKHGNNGENARHVLQDDGGGDQTVVALGVLQLHLILDQVACRCHRLRKATKGLSGQAELWAFLFSTASGAGEIASAAEVPGHVVVQRSLSELVGCATGAPN